MTSTIHFFKYCGDIFFSENTLMFEKDNRIPRIAGCLIGAVVTSSFCMIGVYLISAPEGPPLEVAGIVGYAVGSIVGCLYSSDSSETAKLNQQEGGEQNSLSNHLLNEVLVVEETESGSKRTVTIGDIYGCFPEISSQFQIATEKKEVSNISHEDKIEQMLDHNTKHTTVNESAASKQKRSVVRNRKT